MTDTYLYYICDIKITNDNNYFNIYLRSTFMSSPHYTNTTSCNIQGEIKRIMSPNYTNTTSCNIQGEMKV